VSSGAVAINGAVAVHGAVNGDGNGAALGTAPSAKLSFFLTGPEAWAQATMQPAGRMDLVKL